jgi:hypothetical protein
MWIDAAAASNKQHPQSHILCDQAFQSINCGAEQQAMATTANPRASDMFREFQHAASQRRGSARQHTCNMRLSHMLKLLSLLQHVMQKQMTHFAIIACSCAGTAPVSSSTFSPLKKAWNVGMARTPHSLATSCGVAQQRQHPAYTSE